MLQAITSDPVALAKRLDELPLTFRTIELLGSIQHKEAKNGKSGHRLCA